ncbi:MAG: 50S ribosomal protein L6 [Deltaproteobacteria bacterium]|nr:50S ribosomal protein L6 [Deltaproteobacteria bacterium]
MSRIGKKPIAIPKAVKVAVQNGEVKVEGPKGKLSFRPHQAMTVKVDGGNVVVARPDDERGSRSLHGLTRTLIVNMIVGVEKGFSRELDVNGVGYRAEVKGKDLHLTLGFSHPVVYKLPEGVTAQVTDEKRTHIVLNAASKELLGATAAKIRSFRPVSKDPYGLKGVKYSTERPRQKEGKSGAK